MVKALCCIDAWAVQPNSCSAHSSYLSMVKSFKRIHKGFKLFIIFQWPRGDHLKANELHEQIRNKWSLPLHIFLDSFLENIIKSIAIKFVNQEDKIIQKD